MLAEPAIQRLFENGKSMTVGTVDASGQPTCCRAVGIRVAPDARAVTVYLPLATAPRTVANVASNGRVAICCSDVLDHGSLQLKGRSTNVRVAAEAERAIVGAWHEAFVRVLDQAGMSRRLSRGITCWPAFAIDVEVDAVFDQTPGPRAGQLVSAR